MNLWSRRTIQPGSAGKLSTQSAGTSYGDGIVLSASLGEIAPPVGGLHQTAGRPLIGLHVFSYMSILGDCLFFYSTGAERLGEIIMNRCNLESLDPKVTVPWDLILSHQVVEMYGWYETVRDNKAPTTYWI